MSGKFTDINCDNEIFWGYLGVQKKGLKRENWQKKIIFFKKQKKKKKKTTAYSYNGLEIVSQILD